MEKHIQILLFLFGVFMNSVHSQGWTNVPVKMGQDIILNCSLDQDNVYWYMQQLEGSPVPILRTFDKTLEDFHPFNETFRDRYLVKLGNSLDIHNVTLEEMGFYYCTKEENGTFPMSRLVLVSAGKQPVPTKDCPGNFNFWPLMLVSLAFNLILITVLAGFYLSARCRNKPNHPVTSGITTVNPIYDEMRESGRSTMQDQTSSHVGAAVSEPLLPPGTFVSDLGGVYSQLQLPVQTAPVQ